ncbi:MAG: hypothetical protein CRN43_00385 [Candidatus Nephrothrix sp. EaCA]|nr:MAG: hypothetical protein CRN43_00385 [Candidatus Nephrothrix sp. EaCA]
MYDEAVVSPMREELVQGGFQELKTPQEVDEAMKREGTSLLVVNSICGCAAAGARPGVLWALSNSAHKPNHLITVFAGMEKEAVARAREFTLPYPPSSPAIALFKDGKLVHLIERQDIQGQRAETIGKDVAAALKEYC